MIFDVYSLCLLAAEEDEDVVDVVGGGPSAVVSVGSSLVFLSEGQLSLYTCPLGWEDTVLWLRDHLLLV